MRIGQMLVSAGLLNTDQVEAILRKQQSHPEPFGLLAQRLYGIDPSTIETIVATMASTCEHTHSASAPGPRRSQMSF